jgi:Ni/Co efflux regulator RcnB
MRQNIVPRIFIGVLLLAAVFTAAPALADKPPWAGSDKAGKHGQKQERGQADYGKGHYESAPYYREDGSAVKGHYFGDRQRVVIRDYYAGQFRAGQCPPGLAKKHNGCVPPGQARQWAIGRTLPSDVVFYDLPPQVMVQLGAPLPGYRFVRVASDILMIAIGTGMVVDAIQDLDGM